MAKVQLRNCLKSPEGASNVASQGTEAALFGPFQPLYSGQIHVRSVARTPFQTVSKRSSQNFPSPQLVAQSFKATMDATPEEIAEILGKFERYLIEERRDLVARRQTRPRPSILQIGHRGRFASSPTSFVEPEEGDIPPARSSKRASRDPCVDRPSSCASFVTASRPHLRGSGTRAQQPRSHPLAVRPAR
jgi:hypothetical protein